MFEWVKRLVRWITFDPQAMQNVRLRFLSPEELELWRQGAYDQQFQNRVNADLDDAEVRRTEQRMARQTNVDPDTLGLYGRDHLSMDRNERQLRISRAAAYVADKDNLPQNIPSEENNADQDRLCMPPPPIPGRLRVSPLNMPERTSAPPASGSTVNGSVIARSMPRISHRAMLAVNENAAQLERIKHQVKEVRVPPDCGCWFQSEYGLYCYLTRRGAEALLPAAWAIDFKTFPNVLFETDRESDCLIRNFGGSQFHAIRALRTLVELGKKVRDLLQAKRGMNRVQMTIRKALEDYISWAMIDADLHTTERTIPCHVIHQRTPKQPIENAISDLSIRMHRLLDKHRKYFHPNPIYNPVKQEIEEPEPILHDDSSGYNPPVILGFLIIQGTCTIFSLNARNADYISQTDPDDRGRGIHMLGRFEFRDKRQDVWNAFALAIAACHLRRSLCASAVLRPDFPVINITGDSDSDDISVHGPINPTLIGPSTGADRIPFDHGSIAGYKTKQGLEEYKKRKRELSVVEEEEQGDGDDARQAKRSRSILSKSSVSGKGKGKAKAVQPKSILRKSKSKGKERASTVDIDSDPDL